MQPAVPLHHFRFTPETRLGFQIMPLTELPQIARQPVPHRHDFYELFWISDGAGTHVIDFTDYPVYPHHAYFIAPGQVHYWHLTQPMQGFVLLFTADFLHLNQDEAEGVHQFDLFDPLHSPALSLNAPTADLFDDVCALLLMEYRTNAFGRITVLHALLEVLLVYAQRAYDTTDRSVTQDSNQRITRRYRQLIDAHFLQMRRVEEYAALLNITPGHLTDATRQATGQAASTFIRQRLTLEAKRLLAHSELTIAQICAVLGFDDASYFSRFFRRETDQTPHTFRGLFRNESHDSHE